MKRTTSMRVSVTLQREHNSSIKKAEPSHVTESKQLNTRDHFSYVNIKPYLQMIPRFGNVNTSAFFISFQMMLSVLPFAVKIVWEGHILRQGCVTQFRYQAILCQFSLLTQTQTKTKVNHLPSCDPSSSPDLIGSNCCGDSSCIGRPTCCVNGGVFIACVKIKFELLSIFCWIRLFFKWWGVSLWKRRRRKRRKINYISITDPTFFCTTHLRCNFETGRLSCCSVST